MQSSVLLDKILQLEKELLQLKSQFPAETRRKRILGKAKRGVDGVLAYWVPLALLVGLTVNWWFGVGFFENIKNIGIQKKSSDYYLDIGNNLMSHAEFPAAADAFKKSLEINSNNISATQGLMKAGVLQTLGGSRNPIIVEDVLAYMRQKFGDDYILLYWEGVLRRQLSASPDDLQAAKSLFLRSIKQNPGFPGSHLELANTYLLEGDIDNAALKFNDVTQLDHRFTDAFSNRGYCRFILAHFEIDEKQRQQVLRNAASDLEQARSISPVAQTDLHLGDTYLLMGQYRAAIVAHQNALETLQRAGASKTPESLELLFVFPPTGPAQEHNVGPALTVDTSEELKSLTLYSLSFDYAALKDFKHAQKTFNEASALDARRRFSPLVAVQINALLHLSSIKGPARSWFAKHVNSVCREVEDCLPQTVTSSQKERKQK